MKLRYWLISVGILLLNSCASTHCGYITVSQGGRIYYEERGNGHAVLLLHGHSLDRRMWDEQFAVFARHYRTIRFDFRGYGRSSEQTETMQFTHADDVLTVMDSLHIDRAHLVGLSMGAFVAGDLLAMHPERMISCTLASGGIRKNSPGPSVPMDSAESRRRDVEIEALKQKGVNTMKQEWLDALVNGGGSQRERIRKPLSRMIRDWTAWQPLHKEVRLFYGREAWQQLIKTRPEIPVLILSGETEHKKGTPAEMKYLPYGETITLPDCGHMMNMEQPHVFNTTVLNFIEQTESSPIK